MMRTATAFTSAWTRRGCGPEDRPDREGERRDTDDGWNEDGGNSVREALDRRAAALGLGHHPHDLREDGVAADLQGLDDESAGSVHGRARYGVAGLLGDRNRLAGEHGFVDRARPLDDAAVDGNALPRAHAHPVPRLQALDRNVLVGTVCVHEPRRLRRQAEERPDRAARAIPRNELQDLPDEDERRDDGGGLEVHVVNRGMGRRDGRGRLA